MFLNKTLKTYKETVNMRIKQMNKYAETKVFNSFMVKSSAERIKQSGWFNSRLILSNTINNDK